jgi:hypothetical protein
MKRIIHKVTTPALFTLGLVGIAAGQSFNIDLDVGFGDPGLGNGSPSSNFGAAAGLVGYWNRMGTGDDPQAVLGLGGESTSVQMSAFAGKSGGSAIGFRFEGNTGDYALLLNDARVIGTIIQGGQITYTLSGPGRGDL